MCSIPFTTVDDANKLLIVLLQHAHPCIGVPKPQIRSDSSGYFVDIEERTGGISLKNFLRTPSCLKMLTPEATQTSPALLQHNQQFNWSDQKTPRFRVHVFVQGG